MIQKLVFLYMWSSEIQSSLIKGKLNIRFYFEIIFKEFEIRYKKIMTCLYKFQNKAILACLSLRKIAFYSSMYAKKIICQNTTSQINLDGFLEFWKTFFRPNKLNNKWKYLLTYKKSYYYFVKIKLYYKLTKSLFSIRMFEKFR